MNSINEKYLIDLQLKSEIDRKGLPEVKLDLLDNGVEAISNFYNYYTQLEGVESEAFKLYIEHQLLRINISKFYDDLKIKRN